MAVKFRPGAPFIEVVVFYNLQGLDYDLFLDSKNPAVFINQAERWNTSNTITKTLFFFLISKEDCEKI